MVTASGLRFAATLAVLGFLGFFEVVAFGADPLPRGARGFLRRAGDAFHGLAFDQVHRLAA